MTEGDGILNKLEKDDIVYIFTKNNEKDDKNCEMLIKHHKKQTIQWQD